MKNTPERPTTAAPRDNARSRDQQPQSAREEFLTAEHAGRPEHTPDVEGVLVRVADGSVTLTLEDGEQLVFSETELRQALGDAA